MCPRRQREIKRAAQQRDVPATKFLLQLPPGIGETMKLLQIWNIYHIVNERRFGVFNTECHKGR